MHTSKESRSAGELHYVRFIELAPGDALSDPWKGLVWINFDADRFVLSVHGNPAWPVYTAFEFVDVTYHGYRSALDTFNLPKSCLQSIKNLHIVPSDSDDVFILEWEDEQLMRELRPLLCMKQMTELTIMDIDQPRWYHKGQSGKWELVKPSPPVW